MKRYDFLSNHENYFFKGRIYQDKIIVFCVNTQTEKIDDMFFIYFYRNGLLFPHYDLTSFQKACVNYYNDRLI